MIKVMLENDVYQNRFELIKVDLYTTNFYLHDNY
jgi:hypothetical protein